MIDAKRGLLAKCRNSRGKCYLYKKLVDSIDGYNYHIMSSIPTLLKADNDEEAIKMFAEYCGVRLDDVQR